MTQENVAYILSIARTPTGAFNGGLSSLSATQLGSIAIESALSRSSLAPTAIDEVIFGNVLPANLGQNPARQAALNAGIPNSVPCTTVNKVCASGMKAMTLGVQSILAGTNDIVLVGGMESMTNTPYYVPKARSGLKYGHQQLVDGIVQDGLTDSFNGKLMGNAAEICARKYELSRQEQDDYAVMSYERSREATKKGAFVDEIVPVEIAGVRGKPGKTVTEDEEIHNFMPEKLRTIKPVFEVEGTVTAANASPLSDGASAIVIVSARKVAELGLKPLAKIIGFADAAQESDMFTTSPALAIPKALERAGIALSDVDLFEINEAFSVVSLANMKILGLRKDKVNVNGGAVALGHALGSSGSRIVVSLVNALSKRQVKYGVAAVCNGGGGASAVVVERI